MTIEYKTLSTLISLAELEHQFSNFSSELLLEFLETHNSSNDELNAFLNLDELIEKTQTAPPTSFNDESFYTLYKQFKIVAPLAVNLIFIKILCEKPIDNEKLLQRRNAAVIYFIDKFTVLLTPGHPFKIANSLDSQGQSYTLKLLGSIYALVRNDKGTRDKLDKIFEKRLSAVLKCARDSQNELKNNVINFLKRSFITNKDAILRVGIEWYRELVENSDSAKKESHLRSLIRLWKSESDLLIESDLEWLKITIDELPSSKLSLREKASEFAHFTLGKKFNAVLTCSTIAMLASLPKVAQEMFAYHNENDLSSASNFLKSYGILALEAAYFVGITYCSNHRSTLFHNPNERIRFPTWANELYESLKASKELCKLKL